MLQITLLNLYLSVGKHKYSIDLLRFVFSSLFQLHMVNEFCLCNCAIDQVTFQGPSIFCSICEKEGHLKTDCPDDKMPEIVPLPPVTPAHLHILTDVIKQVPSKLTKAVTCSYIVLLMKIQDKFNFNSCFDNMFTVKQRSMLMYLQRISV